MNTEVVWKLFYQAISYKNNKNNTQFHHQSVWNKASNPVGGSESHLTMRLASLPNNYLKNNLMNHKNKGIQIQSCA